MGAGPGGLGQQYTPSAIKSIGDQDAVKYLRSWISLNRQTGFIEEHTEWNDAMKNSAFDFSNQINGSNRELSSTDYYNGNSLKGAFENGTSFEWAYEGTTSHSFSVLGLRDEKSIYDNFVLKGSTTTNATKPSPTTPVVFPEPTIETPPDVDPDALPTDTPSDVPTRRFTKRTIRARQIKPQSIRFPVMYKKPTVDVEVPSGIKSIPGPYPTDPVTVQDHLGFGGQLTGCHIKDQSLAVLSMPSMSTEQGNWTTPIMDFSAAVQDFIKKSKDAGMQKVVIDLQANGGGSVVLDYEVFKLVSSFVRLDIA